MPAYTRAMRAVTCAAIAAALAACGQTGSLYLPDEAIESPVEIRTTAPPAPDDEKKDQKTPGPPGR